MKLIQFWVLCTIITILSCSPTSSGPLSPIVVDSSAFETANEHPLKARIREFLTSHPTHLESILPDNRTLDQLKIAACTGPTGKWFCKNVAKPTVLAASTSPILPISWTNPAWFVDPANSSTTASDNNDCVTAITPCLTYNEINSHRWGCTGNPVACPRLQQNTSITWLSSVSNASDIVYFTPAIESGSFANLNCAIPTGTAGVLSNVTAGGAPTRTALFLAQAPGVTVAGSMLINTTHPGVAWAVSVSSGSIWRWSQPTARTVTPAAFATPPAEVTTWVNGDSVNMITPSQMTNVAFGLVSPFDANYGAGNTSGITYVNDCRFFSENASALVRFNENVAPQENNIERSFQVTKAGEGTGFALGYWFNNYIDGPFAGLRGASNGTILTGGVIAASQTHIDDCIIDNDVVFSNSGGTSTFIGTSPDNSSADSSIGAAFIDTAKNIFVTSSVSAISLFTSSVIYGPGTLSATGSGRIKYGGGAGKATSTFTNGTLNINGQSIGCINIGSAAVNTAPCNLAVSASIMDANLGTTPGCLYSGMNGFCNY
jgi:hypothetical protein